MARFAVSAIVLVTVVCLNLFMTCSADDEKHHKVIIHVPYKIHTVHHHSVKKIPVYHYYDHHDHHHHHHHHHKEESHGHDWD